MLRNKEIVVENGKIARIDAAVGKPDIDPSGLTVTAGWIDTHTHPGWYFDKDGHYDRAGATARPRHKRALLRTEANAFATLMGGFTAVQSLGQPIDVPLRDLIALGALPGPRILTAIQRITETSGTPDQIGAEGAATQEQGADVIKLFATASIREAAR